MIRAVLWDFGGVLTTSPFEAFNRFEQERGLPRDFIRGLNARNPDTNSWARFERGQLSADEFDRGFLEESTQAGHPVRGAIVLSLLAGDIRPTMVEALRRCRAHVTTACLTNNFRRPAAVGAGPADAAVEGSSAELATGGAVRSLWTEDPSRGLGAFERLRPLFDVVIESSVIGVRKPDPEFYRHALEAIEAKPGECVFLDDLGVNLKPARALGMHTIKVTQPEQALDELGRILGLDLRGPTDPGRSAP